MVIRDAFAQARIVPVLTVGDIDRAVDLAGALIAGGLTVLEVTLRTRTALGAVHAIASAYPGALVGVGTLTRADEIGPAIEAGARFAVSPGLVDALARAAEGARIPYMPAVHTASEIIRARDLGFTALKFFPAKAAGGIQAMQSFAPVFPDIAFCPTGGIGPAEFMDYLRLDNVFAVGGSWMMPADLVKAQDWRAIEALARQLAVGVGAASVA